MRGLQSHEILRARALSLIATAAIIVPSSIRHNEMLYNQIVAHRHSAYIDHVLIVCVCVYRLLFRFTPAPGTLSADQTGWQQQPFN